MNLNFDQLYEVDWHAVLPILIPILLVNIILMFIAFLDMYIYRESRDKKLFWVIIILLFNTFGSVLYLVIGRKKG